MNNYGSIISEIFGDPIDKEMLFVKGEQSDYIIQDDLEDIQDLFPNATLTTIPDAGHWVHADQPTLLLNQVVDFFEGVSN